MKLAGSIALVTGANRGLGLAFAKALVETGAKVYAAARNPGAVTLKGVVSRLHAGFIDTDLARNVDAPKSSPEEIVRTTLDVLERGEGQVLADEITRQVHRDLSADIPAYFRSTALRSRAGLPAASTLHRVR
jgi:NAD(P)-dependent dehydrogenase (short-subunit alcohol dehydrogenase family)